MKQTTNYQLPQWEMTDRVLMDDFNGMTEKLDEVLAGKAQVACGTYVGTGEYNEGHPTTLEFAFQPKIIFIAAQSRPYGSDQAMLIRGQDRFCNFTTANADYQCLCTWTERGISWYNEHNAQYQFNTSGKVYVYCAIG